MSLLKGLNVWVSSRTNRQADWKRRMLSFKQYLLKVRTLKTERLDTTNPETAAKQLYQRLEDMRMELFVKDLQYPRSDETVALHL